MYSSNYNQTTFVGVKHNHAHYTDLTQHGERGVITGLRVFWHEFIVGLELAFGGQSAGPVKGTLNDTIFEDKVDLLSGDFITQIFGRYNKDVITCFGFKTSKGYNRVWGDPTKGDPFHLEQQNHYVKSLIIGVTNHVCYLQPVFDEIMFLGARRLENSTSGRWTSEVGKRHNDTEDFDDLDWMKDKLNYSMNEVKIWHDGQFVHGVQFIYNMDGAKKTPGKHCAEVNGLRCETLSFAEDEHITKVLVKAGDVIDALVFFTDKGRRIGGGGNGGQAYIAIPPPNHHFMSVTGGTGKKYLHKVFFGFDEIF
jgi:hypothetical protein